MTGPLHLDYATRDYDGFRQLLLSVIDRQDTGWSERAAADVGVMVVELLAYELDRLAYAGDRVAEESFLATARRRESARRHAALGDHELDRGNATRGFQWFQLARHQRLTLPAGTAVASPIDPGDPDATRVYAETLDPAQLDARRNWFVLTRAALANTKVVRLAGGADAPRDLRELGLAAGMTLIIGTPFDPEPGLTPTAPGEPLQLGRGEVVRIATVMPHGIELERALDTTWPDGAWVLGNVVEIRRGLRSEATVLGRGGAALGELANEAFLQLRMDVVRRLRAEAEDARAAWIGRPSLTAAWTAACQAMTAVRRTLSHADLSSYDVRDARQRAALQLLAAPLDDAADGFRHILTAIDHDVPHELQASDRVAVPRQPIALPPLDQPVLWMDRDDERPARSQTLHVVVEPGAVAWTEQPDLLRSAPDDPHYVVEIDGNSQITLRFGDGVTGAMLPADGEVTAWWVAGDESGADLRAGALGVTLDPQPAVLATSNPLPTTGGRAPEPLDGLAARIETALDIPAVPITREDYQILLEQRAGIAEAAVVVRGGVVDLVIRPAAGVAASQVLETTRRWLDRERLAGATVTVRLPRPLVIDLGLVVDVHPDVSAADLRDRVQRALATAFSDVQPASREQPPVLLGRTRERAEIYRLVEAVPGVLWSQLIVFERAGSAGVREAIVPAFDQVVRCAGSDELPAGGQITIWTARRYTLRVAVTYDTPDRRPELGAIQRLLPALLSGPASLPVTRGWTVLTAALIDDALAGVFGGTGYAVTVQQLIAERRVVDELELGARELPILDTATVIDGGLRKHP
ncbi:MAG: baseplate J/gp47 family protein [Kofleriaceae bacterium]